jgi:hypothetical protein
MPLRDVKQIKERYVHPRLWRPSWNFYLMFLRQDAVQDLIDHPTFEADFSKLARGLPLP